MPTGGVTRAMRRAPRSASEYEEEEEARPRRRSRDEEDDTEERPTRRARRRDEDDEEEAPRRSRSRTRDEDDEEEEERPRRRSRARDEGDDEDDRPRRRSRRDEEEDDDDEDEPRPAARRSRRDEDDEEEDEDATGWGGANRVFKDMPSDFATDFQVPDGDKEDPVIIKFLDPEPFYTYQQHWCEWLPKGSKLGHLCPKVDCPLCDAGVKVQAKSCFNVIDFSDKKHPEVKVWRIGITLARLLERYSKQPRTGPLDRPDLYFEVVRTGGGGRGSGGRVQTNVNPIKARDLYDEYKIEPLEDDEVETFEKKAFTKKDVVQPTPRSELKQIARAIKD